METTKYCELQFRQQSTAKLQFRQQSTATALQQSTANYNEDIKPLSLHHVH